MTPRNTLTLGTVTYQNDARATTRALELLAEVLLHYEESKKREPKPPPAAD